MSADVSFSCVESSGFSCRCLYVARSESASLLMRWSKSFWAKSGAEMQSAALRESKTVRITERIESTRKRSAILALLAGDDAHSFYFGCGAVGTDLSLYPPLSCYGANCGLHSRWKSRDFNFPERFEWRLAVNRRFSFLVVALVVAGIISVNGAFSQPTPQT